LYFEKEGLIFALLSKKLPKVNNRPFGENSPNLVTLGRWLKWSKNGQTDF
jgi:hypothetical protein